ncbi:MAG TPA: hypothetical protein VD793_06555 [Gemmatimonadales bacterium]|nr:hypothetical protein [Gemmatimonadales bacterium]
MRVATSVAQAMPPAEIERIWLFAPVRQEDREWGTAVIGRRAGGDRLRVYTARYMLMVRGRERGQHRVAVEEVGESPAAVIDEVIRGVQERAGEADPPVEVATTVWYGPEPTAPGVGGENEPGGAATPAAHLSHKDPTR